MTILEYGDINKPLLVLIHGFESPVEVWAEYVNYFLEEYHLIVPILPGHNPKEREDFVNFDLVIKELEEVLLKINKPIKLLYGMSMGGAVCGKLFESNKLEIQNLVFDGSPLLGFNSFMQKMMANTYLNLPHKGQKRNPKTIKQAVNSIIPKEKLFVFLDVLDNISDDTITNYINELASYHIKNDVKNDTKIYFYHGTKMNELLANKSANYLKKYYPNTQIKVFKGCGHCEISIFKPLQMIKEIEVIINKNGL